MTADLSASSGPSAPEADECAYSWCRRPQAEHGPGDSGRLPEVSSHAYEARVDETPSPTVGDLADLLGLHRWMAMRNGGGSGCRGCTWTFPVGQTERARRAHERHVAEVIAASRVVVPAAEVREGLGGLAAEYETYADRREGEGATRKAAEWRDRATDLRTLLARLAGEGR